MDSMFKKMAGKDDDQKQSLYDPEMKLMEMR